MKHLIATLTFMMAANAGVAQTCTPYFVVDFCMEGTYWDGVGTHEFDRMLFWENETTHLEVGYMGSIGYEEFIGPDFDALNAVMDGIFDNAPNISIDRFKPLGDDIPAITNTSLYTAGHRALVHTLIAVNGMMLWVITSETGAAVSETHIQRHIEAINSIRARP
ncbi:MAG: hypothetical protein V3V13_01560 [Paracoccaceae bacterium]